MVASDSLNENHTTIIINIKDVNDLPPEFAETLYEKTLDEEKEAPFMMTQVDKASHIKVSYGGSWYC